MIIKLITSHYTFVRGIFIRNIINNVYDYSENAFTKF